MLEPALARLFSERLSAHCGQPVRLGTARALGGGCISSSSWIETPVGPVFAKWNASVAADLFEREADGLAALAAAGSSLVVPRVYAAAPVTESQPGFILMEALAPGSAGRGEHESLGRGLAQLHGCRAAAFGFPVDSYCGATRQANTWTEDWPSFFRDTRLRPLVAGLDDTGALAPTQRRGYARLLERVPELLAGHHEPSLVHGDLWSGNVLFTAGGPALVDPACAHASREFEFGIATLFGGLSAQAFAAYEEAWPLPEGWRERNRLYQLYHLLNHQALFGGGYGDQAWSVARRYV